METKRQENTNFVNNMESHETYLVRNDLRHKKITIDTAAPVVLKNNTVARCLIATFPACCSLHQTIHDCCSSVLSISRRYTFYYFFGSFSTLILWTRPNQISYFYYFIIIRYSLFKSVVSSQMHFLSFGCLFHSMFLLLICCFLSLYSCFHVLFKNFWYNFFFSSTSSPTF